MENLDTNSSESGQESPISIPQPNQVQTVNFVSLNFGIEEYLPLTTNTFDSLHSHVPHKN